MKKEELKNIIKPLIKECLKEVLIEEGFAKILSENREIETFQPAMKVTQQFKQENIQKQKINLQEVKKKMLDEIGMGGFDAFAGTKPIPDVGSTMPTGAPVTTFNSSDPGIDISRLMSGKLKATFNALNGKKVK
jgi:hypothetical protein